MKTEILVHGYWLANGRAGRGPLGQSAAQYPFRSLNSSERMILLGEDEARRLTHCSLCGRATTNPDYHVIRNNVYAPHCKVCAGHTDEEGRIIGWYGGPRQVMVS